MIGRVFLTSSGYDPKLGKLVNDPYLGKVPTLGACRPDIRRVLDVGDHVFVVSGKIPRADQYIIGGFEIAAKISANDAYRLLPSQRLRKGKDGQVVGNIIVDKNGDQHPLDEHAGFEARLDNYVIGRSPIVLRSDAEVARGRERTFDILQEVLGDDDEAHRPIDLLGRSGRVLSARQVHKLRSFLEGLKD